MAFKTGFLFIVFVSLLFLNCRKDDDGYITLESEENEAFSGGETTIFDISPNAFGFQAPNLDDENGLLFFTGNSLFNQNWVTAPSSTTARDGLGPLFNAHSCSGCHFKDGRGRGPDFDGEKSTGLLFRLSIPGTDAYGRNLPDPNYGGQFQDDAIPGRSAEGQVVVAYQPLVVNYPDGATVSLQDPDYSFTGLNYGPMAPDVQVSPRVASQVIGLGLLDAIPENVILSYADENDDNEDGISGRPNYVYEITSGSMALGRFGWKCNQPSLKQQIVSAFLGDLGITTSLLPDENCPPGVDCSSVPNGGNPEISDENLDKMVLYSQTLAVPGRRDVDDQHILEGKQLFNAARCTACHLPLLKTGDYPVPALENQTIRPYTDLLLHDMGPGLADDTPEFKASGSEWRTAPLWGIGLIETVNQHTRLLHDGRARNVEEAILWHGGEASASREAFMNLNAVERAKLIDFINSL